MAESLGGPHPDAAELQRYADGEVQDDRMAAHVESCAACRAEIAAIRRVTMALSLGSTPPDSLTGRIRARRAAISQDTPAISRRNPRRRARTFMLPVGLAAAATLAIFVPRALREPPGDTSPPVSGAKGALPPDAVLDETIVTETGRTSIDSTSWDVAAPGMTVVIRYFTGRDESPRAERLARRVAERLREAGVDAAAITVRPVLPTASDRPLPPGAVGITVHPPHP